MHNKKLLYILLCAKSNSKGLLGLFWFLFWNRLHQQGRGSIRVMIIIIGTPGEKNREVDISKMAGEKLFLLLPSKCIYSFFMETTQNWTGMVCYYYYFFTKYKLTANKMAKTVWMFLMFRRHGGLRIRTIFRSSMTFVSTKKRALTLAPLYWFFGGKFKNVC